MNDHDEYFEDKVWYVEAWPMVGSCEPPPARAHGNTSDQPAVVSNPMVHLHAVMFAREVRDQGIISPTYNPDAGYGFLIEARETRIDMRPAGLVRLVHMREHKANLPDWHEIVNMQLARNRGLHLQHVKRLSALHKEAQRLIDEVCEGDEEEHYQQIEQLEFQMQRVWGFEENPSEHTWKYRVCRFE